MSVTCSRWVLCHVQGSHAFLGGMGAPGDLRWQTAILARQFAHEHGGAEVLGLATFGSANGLLTAGELGEVLAGMLALSRSLVAAADKRPADVDGPLEYVRRAGEAYW